MRTCSSAKAVGLCWKDRTGGAYDRAAVYAGGHSRSLSGGAVQGAAERRQLVGERASVEHTLGPGGELHRYWRPRRHMVVRAKAPSSSFRPSTAMYQVLAC